MRVAFEYREMISVLLEKGHPDADDYTMSRLIFEMRRLEKEERSQFLRDVSVARAASLEGRDWDKWFAEEYGEPEQESADRAEGWDAETHD